MPAKTFGKTSLVAAAFRSSLVISVAFLLLAVFAGHGHG